MAGDIVGMQNVSGLRLFCSEALSDHMKMCFPQVRLRKRFNARDSAVDVELAVVYLQGIVR